MKLRLTQLAKLTITGLMVTHAPNLYASYWDEIVGSYSAKSTVTPGERISVSVQSCAQRNSDVTIPVYFYQSNDNKFSSNDKYLGSVNTSLQAQGSFCSPVASSQINIPTATHGSCFYPGGGYLLFKVGSDVKAHSYSVVGANTQPTIDEISPISGHPGSVVHIKGQNFDKDTTAVYFGNVEAPRGFEYDQNNNITGIFALVPQGAQSGKITVKTATPTYEFCVGTNAQSPQTFTVTAAPNYCASGAMYSGYGKIDKVESKHVNFDDSNSSDCGGYTDQTNLFTMTEQGTTEAFNLRLSSCGSPDYAKLFKLYVDWNNDEDFDDPGEFVVNAPSVSAATLYNLGLNVPANAEVGTTRMRLITALYYNGSVDTANDVQACGNYPFGQTQDYALDIRPSNGALVATNEALGVRWTSNGLEKGKAMPINPKRKNVKIQNQWIDQAEQNLPPVEFVFPNRK